MIFDVSPAASGGGSRKTKSITLHAAGLSTKARRNTAPDRSSCLASSWSFRLPEFNRAPRRRGGRWVPPGYMAVDDMVSTAPLSRASLYREIASGKLPAIRWRKRVLVPERAYRDWLATVPAGADPVGEETRDE